MHKHRTFRLSYWLLLTIALQLVTAVPVSRAQDTLSTQTAGVAPYQPPASATTMGDFIPGDREQVTAIRDGHGETAVLSPNGSTARFDHDRLLVISDQGNVPVSASLYLELVDTAAPDDTLPGNVRTYQLSLTPVSEGQPFARLSQPLHLILDLGSLELSGTPADWFIAVRSTSGGWYWPQFTLHNGEGLVSATLYQVGDLLTIGSTPSATSSATILAVSDEPNRPQPWRYEWQIPTVSEFNGAATYQYAVPVPPGRGLTPNIDLSYSSRGVDKLITTDGMDQGWLGLGWSMNHIEISRDRVWVAGDGATMHVHHGNAFSLVLNGQRHTLYYGSSAPWGTKGMAVTYYAEDGLGLRVRQIYDPDAVGINTDRLYWLVETSDGTSYRLGYFPAAETGQTVTGALDTETPQQGGARSDYGSLRWLVDTITDVDGNQIQYDYQEWVLPEEIYVGGSGNETGSTSTRTIPTQIRYNYAARATDPFTRVSGSHASQITFVMGLNSRIDDIRLYHSDLSTPYQTIDLTLAMYGRNNLDCAHGEWNSLTQAVDAITVRSRNGDSLPTTVFTYGERQHAEEAALLWCWRFSYLETISNGYGGTVSFSYADDGREVRVGGLPTVGRSSFVTDVYVSDGRNPTTRTHYDYTLACYDQVGGELGSLPGAHTCPTLADQSQYNGEGSLVGFATSTRTAYNFDGSTALNQQTSTFSQVIPTIGQPTQVKVLTGTGTLLSQTDNTYQSETVYGIANLFTYTSQATSTQYQPGSPTLTLQTVTKNYYETAYQGGAQYGQLTRQDVTYKDKNNADITIHRRTNYRVNPDRWLIVPWSQAVYDTNWAQQQVSLYLYDGNTNNPDTQTISQGKLTLSRELLMNNPQPNGSGKKYDSVDTGYHYDVYGNVDVITTHPGYGQAGHDGSVWNYSTLATANPQTTTTAYDSIYHLYPTSVASSSGSLSQTTTFEVYGFNNVTLSGFQTQPGLLKQATGPDSLTTKYEYDPFGRLFAVYDGYSTTGFGDIYPWNGNPLIRYRYWDNWWNSPEYGPSSPLGIGAETRPNDASVAPQEHYSYYDGFGRVIQERKRYTNVDSVGQRDIVTITAYDAQGQVACSSVPFDIAPTDPFVTAACASKDHTTTTYDALGRPLTVTTPDGSQSSYNYSILSSVTVGTDNHLLMTRTTDANSHARSQFTNALGQLVLVREYGGVSGSLSSYADTRYTYDTLGNLTAVRTSNPSDSQPGSFLSESHMTYDSLGRKQTMTDADMGNWSYTYNAAGNLTAQVDGNTHRLCFDYDGLNRITNKRYDADDDGCESNDTLLASYTYYTSGAGKVGQVSAIQWDGSGQNGETFDYNSLGQLTTHTRTIDGRLYTMSYGSYDALGRAHTTTYPDGDVVTTSYDHEGENSLSSSLNGTMVVGIGYNARGQMTSFIRSSMGTSIYSYYPATGSSGNSSFRLQTITHGGSSATLPDFHYSYDPVGNITQINSNGDIQNFSYDHLDRLLSVSGAYSQSYTYDKLGNIATFAGKSYTYDPNHKHAVAAIGSNQSFSYDANGNMTTRNDSTGSYTQSFNVENELSSVTVDGRTTSFSYDASGMRVKTVQPSGVIVYTPFAQYEDEVWPATNTTPGVTLTANGQTALTVPPNTAFTLQWSTTSAIRCAASDSWSGSQDSSGSESMAGFSSGSRTYTLTCRNSAGITNQSVTVAITAPTVTFTVNGQASVMVYDGASFLLQWSSSNVSSCLASASWSGSKPVSGSESQTAHLSSGGGGGGLPGIQTKTYTLTCSGTSGSVSQSVAVNIQPCPYVGGCGSSSSSSSVGAAGAMVQAVTSQVIIQRKTYTLAGQAVAVRVSGDPVTGNNGLHYLYSDHLGSASAILKDADNSTPIITRYMPFGDYRPGSSPNDITDLGFTGQKDNHYIKLIDMGARWYDPAIGRFINPDTIVPDPANPQSFNRYSYVLNRPLVFTDPTGHRPSDGCAYEGCTLANGFDPHGTWQAPDGTQTPWDPIAAVAQDYNPITEAVIPGTVGLFGVAALPTAVGYFAGEVAWPALVKTGSAIASWLCLDGDCGNEGKILLDNISKADAREAIKNGIESLSQGQTQKALDILRSGRIDNFSMQLLDGDELQVIAERAGNDGFQRLIYTLDPSGKTVSLIQEAYNSVGELVHYHDKMP